MNQLTLRGLDKELEQRVRHVTRQQQTSMNKAALSLLRRGAGMDSDGSRDNVIGDQLNDFIGSSTAAQAKQFDAAVAVFEKIDAGQWQ